MKISRALGCAACLLVLACQGEPVPPWGFATRPVQAFEIEMRDRTVVGGEAVEIERLASVRLAAIEPGQETDLSLFLERYYLRVTGAPGGESEVAISSDAFVARTGDEAEVRLSGDDAVPSTGTLRELLERPLSSVFVAPDGSVARSLWHASDPLIREVELLAWLLLVFPVVDSSEAWTASREVPTIGRYRLGVQIPVRYQRDGDSTIRITGLARRAEINVAVGFTGKLELEIEGETTLGADGGLRNATLRLRMGFETKDGSTVRSEHQLEVTCTDCPPGGQIPAADPRSNP